MSLVPLEQARERARFGGKAAHLAADLALGLPVPGGFALDVDAVGRVASGRARVGSDLDGGLWAVRSSAVDEDGAAASFAGQHDSVIGVAPERVDEAVARVYASARTESALAYRRRLGLGAEPRMAVVVQRVVVARASAVVFTKNPLTGAAELVIEAAWGLGEVVVAGLVLPDRFRLSYGGALLERTAGEKDVEVVLADGRSEQRPVQGARQLALCLDDEDLLAIAALCRSVRARHEGEHDLEVAIDDGGVHLLQRRSITR